MSVSRTWGTTADERRQPFPCDRFAAPDWAALYRGVAVRASPATVYRWLCQLRVAPYSYDWIDNFGRTSPRTLTPGLDQLAVGQTFMTIFELVDFEPDRHLTMRLRLGPAARIFGDLAISYLIVPLSSGRCRLLAKLAVVSPQGPLGRLRHDLLAWGDLVMMRRQLLNLKAFAEQSPASRAQMSAASAAQNRSASSSVL